MKKYLNRNQIRIMFVMLLLIQVLYMLYWGHAKSGFYVDEFFTYDNAHYMSASTPKRVKMYDADYMKYDQWFELSELKSTLTVEKNNSLFNDGLMYNINAFMKKPYMTLLNYAETVFFEGELNKWSAIGMNILFFAIGQLFLYLLAKKIADNEGSALLAVAIFGFSGLAVSMVAYVRFYMLVNMWMIIFLYLHALMWLEDNLKKNLVYEVLAVMVLYLAFKNSPLAMIEGGAVICLFSIALLVRKRKRQFLFYAVPIFAGGIIYVALFTNYLQIIFQTKNVTEGSLGVAAASLVNNFLALTPANFVDRSIVLINFINDYLFAHVFVFAIFVILSFAVMIKKVIDKKQPDESRYFVYLVLGGTAVLFFIASVCLKLGEIRYNSFLYPVISVIIAVIATDITGTPKKKMFAAFILTLAVCAEIYFTVSIPRVQNIYPEDKAGVTAIKENIGIDNLVVDYKADDRVMYECLAYGDDTTRVMFMRLENCDFRNTPDTVLVWKSVNWGDEVVERLKDAGYTEIEQIAQTHESNVFLCRR